MQAVRDWFLRRMLGNVPYILECFDERRGCFCEGAAANQHCLRVLAHFYKHAAPGNELLGDGSVLDKIVRAGDAMVSAEKPGRHGGTLGGEWIPYNLLECYDWLGEELGAERKARWREALGRHFEAQGQTNNYIATAPNHFVWRAAVLARAARLFDRPELLRAARMLAKQVCKMQTTDGYWDEAHRGQGPSPSYHRVHLHGLDLYVRNSGDESVRPALERGIAFCVRAAYPDGVPIETFDGRQPYFSSFAMAASALTRTPAGRRLLRNQCAPSDRLGQLDVNRPCGFGLSWYVFAGTDFMLDGYRFMEDGPEAEIPQERDGHADSFVIHGQEGAGGAVTLRKGAWFAAVSAIESDVPRFIPNVYITERQSGFSFFHRDAGLVAGGGNRMRNHAPLANAVVLTGWQDVDCQAGVFHAPYLDEFERDAAGRERTEQAPFASAGLPRPGHEGIDPVKSCYHPLKRRAELRPGGAALTLEFLHGTIRFELELLDDRRARIRYAYETCGVRKLLLQVPVPLFHPYAFELDGAARGVADMEALESPAVRAGVSLRAGPCGATYAVPPGREASFTYPLEPIRNGQIKRMNYVPDPRFKPLYVVGLLSQAFTGDLSAGAGELVTVEIER